MTDSSPLDIALLGPWPPYRGGISQFGVSLHGALRERGHGVHPVTFSRQYPERLFPGQSQFEPEGSTLDHPPAPRLIDSVSPRSWWATARYLRGLKPDVVLFQHWLPFLAPAYGTVARRLKSREQSPARIALVHNALPHERRPGDAALTRYLLRACDGAVALSSAVLDEVHRLAPSLQLIQQPHPVYEQFGPAPQRDEARRDLGLPADAPVLLYFGFVREYKGLDILIEAMPRIVEAHPDTQLLVAGEFYEDEARYRRRVRELGIEQAVRFEAKYIASSDVPRYFGAADLVVQPYRSATQSGVAQTAFGFGRPVVTTNVGGLAETVSDGEDGLIVPPEDPDALARAVAKVLGDEGLAGHLAAGAERARRAGGWDALAEAVEDLAQTLLR